MTLKELETLATICEDGDNRIGLGRKLDALIAYQSKVIAELARELIEVRRQLGATPDGK